MSQRFSAITFAAASLIPAGCLLLGAVFGGLWCYVAVLSISVLVVSLDRSRLRAVASERQADWLPRAVTLAHFTVLPASIWAIGAPDHLTLGEAAAQLLGTGLFVGQVSNACAHELIHRADRLNRLLGTAIYCSLLNGQHVSAHLLVHHVFAGTAKDPNSAPMGQSFWRFFLRASVHEFIAGLRAENRRRQHLPVRMHPYVVYGIGGLISLSASFILAGALGVFALLLLAVHAQMQLLLSDYLQHYGLRRHIAPDGKVERMGPQHSWNAPHDFSAALMLNAPLHSDHHMNPGRTFDRLRLETDTMPTLPRSVPVMGAIALVPPLWRQIMDPRVRHYGAVAAHSNVMPPLTPDTGGRSAVLSE
ncbi:alkane 1-monooxygenase [Roseobacter sp. YSTF-M11]|uniref:Alkane 1-monooxygenase n=1 Tax=Roseobacter insulae TaxID=2859783 RepID=A0A9X1G056_9RHOB|nr:alkane 1-monooxygenase [Roseobacter insulae]MBW4710230.1 alkane 1-monooxygenase [Roseobacter insulae]